MNKFTLAALATFLVSSVAFAATPYRVSTCEFEKQNELDAAAMSGARTNNFSSGVIYTGVTLTEEKFRYTNSVGIAELGLTKAGVELTSFELCNRTGKSKREMSRASVNLDTSYPLNEILKSDKMVTLKLAGSYLNSDEHVVLKGSELTLKNVGKEGPLTIIEGKVKLIVADLTEDANSEIEDVDKLSASETLEGIFYFQVIDAKLK